jgi:phospholipid-binding lipoprotein MlaA
VLLLILLGAAVASPAAAKNPDPWEPFNRAIFGFNEKLDRWIIEPVAKGYDFIMPDPVERCVSNFYDNLRMPLVLANDLVQFKPHAAGHDIGRVVVNTTVGLLGLFDVASKWGIYKSYSDFGLTMARYRVPRGPYFVIPLFGPSTTRDAVGRLVDSTAAAYTYFIPVWGSIAVSTLDLLNTRSRFIDEIAEGRASALDFYIYSREAYLQNRAFKEQGKKVGEAEEEDLYYFDDELDEDLYDDSLYEDDDEGDAGDEGEQGSEDG